MNPLPAYRYGAARTMVHLHGQYLQDALVAWRASKAAAITLPETDNPAYESLETLLRHMLSAARGYMVWMCYKLELPDPQIREVPSLETIEAEAEGYLAHIIDRWALPLAEVDEDRFYRPEYRSNWGVLYCVDAMLEHAVMHAIQHRLQLEELVEEQAEPRSK